MFAQNIVRFFRFRNREFDLIVRLLNKDESASYFLFIIITELSFIEKIS